MYSLTKKLKKRIIESCGLSELGKKDRILLAREIADSNELKQQVCNDLDGVSFRDIDNVLKEIMNVKKSRSSKETIHHENDNDEDHYVDQEQESTYKYKKTKLEFILNQEEINMLIDASEKPFVYEPLKQYDTSYPTYTKAESTKLIYNNTFSDKD